MMYLTSVVSTVAFLAILPTTVDAQIDSLYDRCPDVNATYNLGCPAPASDVTTGIPTMEDLLCIVEQDFVEAQDSDAMDSSEASLVYTLCPNTVYDASDDKYLAAFVDNTVYQCGTDGNPENNCVVEGGTGQVILRDNTAEIQAISELLQIKNVTFRGITFRGADIASVVAQASVMMTATFVDCRFEGAGVFALLQELRDEEERRLRQDDSVVISNSKEAVKQEVQSMANHFLGTDSDQMRSLQEEAPLEQLGQTVIFRGCQITGTMPILEPGDRGPPSDFSIRGQGRFEMYDSTYSLSSRVGAIFASESSILLRNVTITGIQDSVAVILLDKSSAAIEDCRIEESEAVNIVAQEGGYLAIFRTVFEQSVTENYGVIGTMGAELMMVDTCFVDNLFTWPVILTPGATLLNEELSISTNYLADDDFANCTGIYVESEDCGEIICAGECKEFQTNSCSADSPQFTEEPAPTPQTTEPTPMEGNGGSNQPTTSASACLFNIYGLLLALGIVVQLL